MKSSEHKVRIDLKGWDWGDWPDRLGSAIGIDVEKDDGGNVDLRFTLDGATFDNVAQKVATEAIQAFFDSSPTAVITKDGILLLGDTRALLPWDSCFIAGGQEAADAVVDFLRDGITRCGLEWKPRT